MRRAVLAAVVTTALASGGAVALADPGPNGHNDYGLCNAYSSGSATGQAHKHKAPPFAALEAAASAADQTVAQYCANKTPGGK